MRELTSPVLLLRNSFAWLAVLTLLLLLPVTSAAQKDSLVNELRNAKQDSTRLRLCLAIAAQQTNNNIDTTLAYCDKAEALAKKLNSRKGIADATYQRAYAIFYAGESDSAMQMYYRIIPVYRSLGDSVGVAASYNKLGYIHRERGDREIALACYHAALTSNGIDTNISEAANSYLNIGLIHHDEHQLALALKYQLQALALYQRTSEIGRTANCLLRLGNVYGDLKDDSTSMVYYQRGMEMAIRAQNDRLIAICLNNMAGIYSRQNENRKALAMYQQALVIRKRIGDKNGEALLLNNIGAEYTELKMYDSSLYYFEKSIALAEQIKYKDMLETNYASMSKFYAEQGMFKEAFEWEKKHHEIYVEINNEENTREITRLNTQHEADKRLQDIERLEQQGLLDQALIQEEKTRAWFLGVGLAAILVVALLIWRNKRKTDRTNILLETQKAEIADQKKVVEEQHRDIVDSINYALRIQHAVLPSRTELKRLFPESFIIYKPRDIVSGDFWWIAEKNGLKICVVADCTGHGVPGAFMSLIGSQLLNEIVNENGITDPGDILNTLSARVVKALHQSEERTSANDGMDIALAVIDEENEVLRFAGANNSIYFTNIAGELHELKGDRQPIGYYLDQHKPFSVQRISLEEVTNLWMFTDGYPDQFCGNAGTQFGKKMKYSRVRASLTELQGFNVTQQRELLTLRFEEWKGDMFQVDDVLMMGIKFY